MSDFQQNNDEAKLSFEEAMKRLEEIVGILEDGKHNLDETLKIYEEGIGLYRYCNQILEQSERKVMTMIQNDEGQLDEESFVGY